jgi:hypothetical protein
VCDFIVDLQLPAGRTSQPELERHMAGLPPIPAGSNFSAVEELCKQPEEREPPANCCGVDAKTSNRFESVFCEPFLDRETSPLLARAFWVPGHSAGVASFGAYHIMQRIDCCADGGARMTAGAGPGAGVPYLVTSSRQDRNASAPGTRCSSTAGMRASSTRAVRPIRR